MTEKLTKTEAVGILMSLAKDVKIENPVGVNVDEIYELMANNVIDQFYPLPDDQKETVMLATIVKLLTENFVLNMQLTEQRKINATRTDSN